MTEMKKKKKKTISTVATMLIEQTKKILYNCEICCINIIIYMPAHINIKKKKKHKPMTKKKL